MSILDSIRKSMTVRTDSDFIRNLDRESDIYDHEGSSSFTASKLFQSGIAYPEESFEEEPSFFNLMPLGVF